MAGVLLANARKTTLSDKVNTLIGFKDVIYEGYNSLASKQLVIFY